MLPSDEPMNEVGIGAADEVVKLDGAVVRAGGRAILGPVDLVIRRGEHWVLLGPNGSGKTTLLGLAGAWRQPSAGIVRVLGERLGRVDVRRLRPRIGHVSHAVADRLRPALTAEQVVLTGKSSALETWFQELDDRDRAAARALLADAGCSELADHPVGSCSLGERQRVLIARALFGAPELLLLDEPAAGLDLPARERLVAATEAAASRAGGPTTLLATHHLEEIPPAVTHAALLDRGRVMACGLVEQVLADGPLSRCYGMEVTVERRGGRWWGRAR
jgi:iron complex transport system ATP-binding protein